MEKILLPNSSIRVTREYFARVHPDEYVYYDVLNHRGEVVAFCASRADALLPDTVEFCSPFRREARK